MDYVFEVLGRQGWERAESLDDYFIGLPATPDCSPDSDNDPNAVKITKSSDFACQTPSEWLFCSPLQDAKEAGPDDAPTRLVILRTGDAPEPKAPKAAAVHWFPKAGEPSNDQEMLFWSFLVCQVALDAHEVQKTDAWAADVLRQLGPSSIRPNTSDWFMKGSKPGSMIAPLYDAYMNTIWHDPELETIANAMQSWHGIGRCDGLNIGHLRNNLQAKRAAPKVPGAKKSTGPPRITSTATLVGVATMIKQHGVELRKLLRSDEPCGPSLEEELQAATARRAEVEAEAAELRSQLGKARDAHKHAAAALKKKNRAATDARKDERRKLAGVSKAARQKLNREAKAARQRMAEAAAKKAERAVAETTATLRKQVAVARKRARAVEGDAKLSKKRLRRAQAAELAVEQLQAALEEEPEEEEEEPEQGTCEGSRRDANGRWKAMPQQLRVLIWSQLSRRVAPSAVAANISEVLSAYAPDAHRFMPCEREINKMRGELTVASEAIAAFRVALSKRIISFGWDESTKFGLGLLSSNTQIETHQGEIVDVVMRGAALTAGGTASAIAWSIDHKIFTHARQLLTDWKAEHEKQFGAGSWAAAGGPEPESLGIHRLSQETLLMSDTCNGARACKRLVAEAAMKAGKEQIGEEAWEALTQSQRDAKCKTYVGQCHQHLRNIIINAMQIKATEVLKGELEESLSAFTSFDRLSVDAGDLIRAIYKELHGGGAYAKGKGREFTAWVKKHFPSAKLMPFERAEGSRQDLAFDGAVPIFVNRKIILEFLRGMMVPGADNQLEKFLLRVLSCNEMTAMLRVNTLWKYIFSQPTRWLAGKSRKLNCWSIDSSSKVMDLVEKAMVEIAADGQVLLDPAFDPFKSIADEQPLFETFRHELHASVHALALAEARNPASADGGNAQATEKVVQLAEQMANAALIAMRDPKRAICSLLTSQDGEHAAGKDSGVHAATIGANVTNDRVESNFGCMDMLMRMYRYATVENIAGMAQQMHNQDFEQPAQIDRERGRKRKAVDEAAASRGGFFYNGLSSELRQSLVDFTRRAAEGARKAGRSALAEQEAERLSRREERVITLLNRAVEHYAYAKECFEAWQTQRATTKQQVAKALRDENGKAKPEAAQLEYLRYQIEMRVLGCGWSEYATRWSSKADSRIGTVAHLHTLLEEIIEEERSRARFTPGSEYGLPTEAAPPHLESRDLGQLGTLDADAQEISKRSLFSVSELEAKAQEAMERREAAGIADSVERMQPDDAPAFDQALVGKRLEVLWKYFEKDTNKQHMIWASGTVKRIADGLTDKRSSRAQKVLPAGAVLWAWEADPDRNEPAGEQWLLLLPKKWNPKTHTQVYSWRYDPRELGATQGRAPDERRQNMRRAVADEL